MNVDTGNLPDRLEVRICALGEVRDHIDWATHVISIIQKERAHELPPWNHVPAQVLQLRFRDMQPSELLFPQAMREDGPTMEHIARLIDFACKLPSASRLLVHCEAGISRSGAAAWIALTAARPETDPKAHLEHLRLVRPQIHPNALMVTLADRLLRKQGALVRALADFQH